MGREKLNYRANIANIRDAFPGVGALSVAQAAQWLGVDKRTIVAMIERRVNPLPAANVSLGKKNKVYRVSVEALARFVS
jgi:excisionase family DNA binding protein